MSQAEASRMRRGWRRHSGLRLQRRGSASPCRPGRRQSAVEGLEGRTLLAFAPAGGEFQVNTFTTSYQYAPDVAADADGDFVVVWQSRDQDGSDYGVYGQRYNAAGVRQGSEFLVNTRTDGRQRWPRVAMDADGDFVVTWTSYDQDGDGAGVYAPSATTPPASPAGRVPRQHDDRRRLGRRMALVGGPGRGPERRLRAAHRR